MGLRNHFGYILDEAMRHVVFMPTDAILHDSSGGMKPDSVLVDELKQNTRSSLAIERLKEHF